MVEPKPNFTFQEFYNRLVNESIIDELHEDEFTVNQFARDTGLSIRTAMNRLTYLVEKGVLKKRFALYEGKRCLAYSKADDVKSGSDDQKN